MKVEITSATISLSESKEFFFSIREQELGRRLKNNLMFRFATIFPPLQSMEYYESMAD